MKVAWIQRELATSERARKGVTAMLRLCIDVPSAMLRLCIDVPAVSGVLLAIDHQEHFNRESVAR
jgi:hypothetical protein